MPRYDAKFYDMVREEAQRGADVVVPKIVELLRPTSVIDVGCGEGVWLSKFRESGVQRVLGIDGDYVDRSRLLISDDEFLALDLKKSFAEQVENDWDLLVSLEVAEHLPDSSADRFVEQLVALANTIVFSAAIPGQGGIGHLNEQWQSYWINKFAHWGYYASSGLREWFWNESTVPPYYRQNILLFSADDYGRFDRIRLMDVVHPDLWRFKMGLG